MTDAPAFLRNRRLDILAANALGRALYAPMFDHAAGPRPPNICRFVFLDARAPEFFVDWEPSADQCVAVLRSQTGRAPDDRGLAQLVEELCERSEAFNARWASHNVHFHDTGIKRIRHPVVGALQLAFNRLEVSADRGLTILAYAAEPGSREAESLELLASWAATPDEQPLRPPPGA
jgi:hypothetical protein